MNSRVFLFTPNLAGHRRLWHKHLVQHARNLNIEIIVFCQDVSVTSQKSDSKNEILFARNLQDFKRLSRLMGFVPDKDTYLFWEADKILLQLLFFPRKSKKLVVRPYLQNWKPRQLSAFTYKMMLVLIHKMKSPQDIRLLKIPYSRPFFLPRSWIDDDLLAVANKEALSMVALENRNAKSTVGILIPGYINKRKSPELLSRIVDKLENSSGERVMATVYGSMPLDYENELKRFQNIDTVNKFLTDLEYFRIIRASDLVLLPYKNRGSSNIVLEAMALGKPVVMSRNRHWREFENQFTAFKMVKANTTSSYVSTIQRFMNTEFVADVPFLSNKSSNLLLFFLAVA